MDEIKKLLGDINEKVNRINNLRKRKMTTETYQHETKHVKKAL